LNQKVAVVTGSSSGIGFETAMLLSRNGFYTYATMRNLRKSGGITQIAEKERLPLQVLQLDVNDDQSVKAAVDQIAKEKQRIDVLVNNAGFLMVGCVEDLSIDEFKAQFETNLFGVIRVSQRILPYMRKQKQGIIVNVSSAAGRIAVPTVPAHTSAKFAVEGLSEALKYEVEPFGIKIVIVEPGVIKTNIMNASVAGKRAQDPNSPYAQMMQKVMARFSSFFENAPLPIEVAKVILEAISAESPDTRYLVGDDAITMVEARKNMADLEFERLWKSYLFESDAQVQ
jgi:NAD(P)-dependent dehydrogenase (short-subunit alcohol dehydrogenase family)